MYIKEKQLCKFYAFTLYISFWNYCYGSSENSSVILKDDYENIYENESYEITISDQNDLALKNVSLFNESFPNLTQVRSNFAEELDDLQKWEQSNYLSFKITDGNTCACDLTFNMCDINCCCDLDCNDDNIKVFGKCKSNIVPNSEHFCSFTHLIMKNNTIYKIKKEPFSGLFCIEYDNLRRYLRFKELPAVKSQRDIETVLKFLSKSVFSWDSTKKEITTSSSELKYGDPIYISYTDNESSETPWSLPTSCFSGICSCEKTVRYLQETSSTCNRRIENLEDDCTNNAALSAETYSNFCIDVLKNLGTHTKIITLNDETDSNLISICVDAQPSQVLKTKFSRNTNMCHNIVNYINFTVYHDGIYGITSIDVSFSYMNISQNYSISQRFKVDFKWHNSSDVVKKSGNPGYNIGLPVITGTNSSKEEPFRINIQPEGLTVLSRDSKSQCQGRKAVKFGKNLKTSCYLKSNFKDCESAQESIYDLLLDSIKDHIFVGVFGNVNESNSKDWIEAYHEKPNVYAAGKTCNLITKVDIKVPYAAVGALLNPQFKILGLGYHYSDVSCVLPCTDLILSTSVTFFDVTVPAISHYPKIPSIKINLPADFFYPFSQNTKDL